ncbi:response regulator [Streptomyces sp. NPDC056660]|uniref:response regulator n=1 Tax=Streptomyces sp. NPDC056660 TaxID=3345897 RepID=UPI0036CAEBFF
MTTLLIVDDESPQRLAVRMILERQPGLTVVGETGNGSEAVRMASALQPDIVLMDVHMPGMDGAEATRRIVDSGSRSRVLVLTTFDLEERDYKALRAGASDFLLKDARPEELIAAVHAVARGDAVIAPDLTRKLLDTFAHRLHSPVPDQDHDDSGRLYHLTGREREVLTRVASGRSNGEIAEDLHLAETTIKSHVSRVLAKIGARTRVQAVAFAYEAGLVRPDLRM